VHAFNFFLPRHYCTLLSLVCQAHWENNFAEHVKLSMEALSGFTVKVAQFLEAVPNERDTGS
jgi:hypothetical protein